MSGETENSVSGWTVDTLHTYLQTQLRDLKDLLDERHANQRTAMDAALAAAEKAVSKAEAATEKRFDSVNEFRGQLSDQAAQFLPREEYKTAHEALVEKLHTAIESKTRELAEMDRRHNLDIQALASRLDRSQGQDVGQIVSADRSNAVRNQLMTLAGVILTALAIVVTVIISTR